MRVKICGLTAAPGLDAAVAGGADWLGFNFFPPSPRYVAPEAAAALVARAGATPKVGLFVKPSDAEIEAVLAGVALDILQIYDAAPRAAAIRARFGLPVWLPLGVAARADLPGRIEGVDALLIEAKAPPGATRPGGNAVSFDWTILAGWQAPMPWLLAGGLDAGNVAEAIRASGASAVDVSSGVEREKGVKDPALVADFMRAARAA
jgi:phosphoribosylanthranilate isomerase